jgi:hypothetical protein
MEKLAKMSNVDQTTEPHGGEHSLNATRPELLLGRKLM